MHMVHLNTKYEADDAGNHPDGYLVVGILFDEGKEGKHKVKNLIWLKSKVYL